MKIHKLFWGLLVFGAGILLLLSAFGIGEQYDMFRIIGSILLLGISIASVVKLNFFLFFIPLSFVAYLWRVQLGIADMNLLVLLAASALLGIGMSLIFRKKSHQFSEKACNQYGRTEETMNENEFVNVESSFGEHIKYIHADNLKRAKINSSFSSTKVYFDQCQVSSEGLEINVSASFTEVIISLPKSWVIDNQISTFAGVVNEVHRFPEPGQTAVKLTGNVSFGELKILYI